jgi:hypothetical protein
MKSVIMNGVRKVNVWSESGKGRLELKLDKIREDTGKRAVRWYEEMISEREECKFMQEGARKKKKRQKEGNTL